MDDLKAVVLKVNSLEEERGISPWDDEHIPEEIVSAKPNPGYSFLMIKFTMNECIALVIKCLESSW